MLAILCFHLWNVIAYGLKLYRRPNVLKDDIKYVQEAES